MAGLMAELLLAAERSGSPSLRELRSRLRPGGIVWDCWHDMSAREITHQHVAAWVRALLDTGRAANTVRVLVSVLSMVLEEAVRCGAAERNPCRDLPRGTLPPAQPRDPGRRPAEVLSPAEVETLLELDLPTPRAVMWRLLLGLGLRVGEASALRYGDVAQRSPLREVLVRRSWSCRDHEYRAPKSGHPRRVPASPLVEEALRMAAGRRRRGSDELVTASASGEPWHENTLLRWWRRDLEAAGVPRPAAGPRSVHSSRHTFCQSLLDAGCDWRVIEAMTHAPGRRGESALVVYARPSWAAMCAAVDRLPYGAAHRRAC